jgi:hypothetical protein
MICIWRRFSRLDGFCHGIRAKITQTMKSCAQFICKLHYAALLRGRSHSEATGDLGLNVVRISIITPPQPCKRKKNVLRCQRPIFQGNCYGATLLQKDIQLFLSVALAWKVLHTLWIYRTTTYCFMKRRATVIKVLQLVNTLLVFDFLSSHKSMLFRSELCLELCTLNLCKYFSFLGKWKLKKTWWPTWVFIQYSALITTGKVERIT